MQAQTVTVREQEDETMYNYLPAKDADLETWTDTFLSVAQQNLAEIGLTTADLNSATGNNTAFAIGISTIALNKAALKQSVVDKDVARTALVHDLRSLVKRIQAKPGVSAGLKASLGINDNTGGRTTAPPVTPVNVMADGNSLGVNSVHWDKNGNIPNTQYVVEAKKPADTTWTVIGQTTKSKFDHTGQTPGVALSYRIVAARADKAAVPSAIATVYGS